MLEGNAEEATAKPSRLYIGIDGTGVGMRGGGTRESKTGVIYETRERGEKTEVVNSEYLGTLERVDSFGEQVGGAGLSTGRGERWGSGLSWRRCVVDMAIFRASLSQSRADIGLLPCQ